MSEPKRQRSFDAEWNRKVTTPIDKAQAASRALLEAQRNLRKALDGKA